MKKLIMLAILASALVKAETVNADILVNANAGVSRAIAEDLRQAIDIASERQETSEAIEAVEAEEPDTLTAEELELLAKCVEAEAATEGLKGKRLVVDVILNRVADGEFDDSITAVITAKNQFATWANGMIADAEPTEETFKAIELELAVQLDSKILYFTAGGYNPYCTPAYKYKNHYFGY